MLANPTVSDEDSILSAIRTNREQARSYRCNWVPVNGYVLDQTPVLLFRARFDRSFWRSLGEGLSTARKESLQQFAVQATLLASVDDKDKPQ